MANIKNLHEQMRVHSEKDKAHIALVFLYAKEKELLSSRSYKTACTLAEIGMDAHSVAVGLLYNALEEEHMHEEYIQKEFGEEVLFLLRGVTELTKHRYKGLERHKESLRKLLLVVSEDVRVLIIKLIERLHRFETLSGDTKDKQQRVALETLEIYAPIAHRLGMGHIKGALEDLAFPYIYPKECEEIQRLLKERSKETEKYLEKTYRSLQKELFKEGIKPITSDYRLKHIYSLYKKLKHYNMDIDEIYDIAALRVVVETPKECYQTLGCIHGLWEPLPGRIKDYIASPKLNSYKSLHTTVSTGDGGIVEIQIRTEKMHREAEYGVASHFAYKESPSIYKNLQGKATSWMREFMRWQKKAHDSGFASHNFRVDFFKDRVFIFTPNGDVIDLPKGSTPVDFAYAIHSKIGDNMSGAKINKKLCSLGTPLINGDKVEIVTKKGGHPSQKWLEYAVTPLAKRHIKSALQKDSRGL